MLVFLQELLVVIIIYFNKCFRKFNKSSSLWKIQQRTSDNLLTMLESYIYIVCFFLFHFIIIIFLWIHINKFPQMKKYPYFKK